jgi:hypothetical protein
LQNLPPDGTVTEKETKNICRVSVEISTQIIKTEGAKEFPLSIHLEISSFFF